MKNNKLNLRSAVKKKGTPKSTLLEKLKALKFTTIKYYKEKNLVIWIMEMSH